MNSRDSNLLFKEGSKLAGIYDSLMKLDYELSDDEKAMLDGSHELFAEARKLKDSYNDSSDTFGDAFDEEEYDEDDNDNGAEDECAVHDDEPATSNAIPFEPDEDIENYRSYIQVRRRMVEYQRLQDVRQSQTDKYYVQERIVGNDKGVLNIMQ